MHQGVRNIPTEKHLDALIVHMHLFLLRKCKFMNKLEKFLDDASVHARKLDC